MRAKDSHYFAYQLDSKTSNDLLHPFIDVLQCEQLYYVLRLYQLYPYLGSDGNEQLLPCGIPTVGIVLEFRR